MRTKSILFPNSLAEFSPLFDKLQRNAINLPLNSCGAAIKGGSGSPTAAFANTTYVLVDGVLVKKTAGDFAALSGTVLTTKFNVFVFTINAAGTLATYMGTAGATLPLVVFPDIPDGEVALAFVIINPTGTGSFVGGSIDLDDGTKVPNAAFVNIVGGILPELAEL